MTLQMIRDKYLGKKLDLYLIDGEEVVLDKTGALTFQFKAEIFDDEALEITNSLCKASMKLNEERAVALACRGKHESTIGLKIGLVGLVAFIKATFTFATIHRVAIKKAVYCINTTIFNIRDISYFLAKHSIFGIHTKCSSEQEKQREEYIFSHKQ